MQRLLFGCHAVLRCAAPLWPKVALPHTLPAIWITSHPPTAPIVASLLRP
jgi:hypothetical protein